VTAVAADPAQQRAAQGARAVWGPPRRAVRAAGIPPGPGQRPARRAREEITPSWPTGSATTCASSPTWRVHAVAGRLAVARRRAARPGAAPGAVERAVKLSTRTPPRLTPPGSAARGRPPFAARPARRGGRDPVPRSPRSGTRSRPGSGRGGRQQRGGAARAHGGSAVAGLPPAGSPGRPGLTAEPRLPSGYPAPWAWRDAAAQADVLAGGPAGLPLTRRTPPRRWRPTQD
jgi:hypothetical protein